VVGGGREWVSHRIFVVYIVLLFGFLLCGVNSRRHKAKNAGDDENFKFKVAF
jgi:hypothetical protein